MGFFLIFLFFINTVYLFTSSPLQAASAINFKSKREAELFFVPVHSRPLGLPRHPIGPLLELPFKRKLQIVRKFHTLLKKKANEEIALFKSLLEKQYVGLAKEKNRNFIKQCINTADYALLVLSMLDSRVVPYSESGVSGVDKGAIIDFLLDQALCLLVVNEEDLVLSDSSFLIIGKEKAVAQQLCAQRSDPEELSDPELIDYVSEKSEDEERTPLFSDQELIDSELPLEYQIQE